MQAPLSEILMNAFKKKMRCKWYFWNEPIESILKKPTFCVKSIWNLSDGHSALELFLSKLDKEVFSLRL